MKPVYNTYLYRNVKKADINIARIQRPQAMYTQM